MPSMVPSFPHFPATLKLGTKQGLGCQNGVQRQGDL
jgi:hypothetical protein